MTRAAFRQILADRKAAGNQPFLCGVDMHPLDMQELFAEVVPDGATDVRMLGVEVHANTAVPRGMAVPCECEGA